MAEKTRTRVVIVGSGFAGYECAHKLVKRLGKAGRDDVEVILVSPQDYLLYTPLLPDVAGGLIDPRNVSVSLSQGLHGVTLVPALATAVDLDARTVTARSTADDSELTLDYDRLVLTAGSVTRQFGIPGLAEHARGLKTVAEAVYLRDQMLHQLELAVHETDPEIRQGRRTVVVVGASYAGSELVAQLRALADAAAATGRFAASDVRFLLVDVAKAVMPEVGAELGERALGVLRARGIEVRLETSLSSLTAEHVVLTDGTTVPARTVAWVAGVTAHPLMGLLGLPLERGRLVVRPDLSVEGHPDVFAGGDAAAVPDLTKPGSITPPTAQHAVRQGWRLGRNVAASLGVGTAKDYKHRDLGLVVDLGPGFAVANPLGLSLSGWPAKVVTRGYHLAALPRMSNRLRVALDWASDLVTQRQVVQFGLVSREQASVADAEHLQLSPPAAPAESAATAEAAAAVPAA